ncbi:MFS transporter [Niallia taxi]|uniref:MFS transporter n=1 Tax=Niallia taxi TaxID=2499688 RepID=UPI00300B99D0
MILRIIIFSVFAFQLIINITRPIITLYASNLGSNTFEIGILTAAFAFFPLLFALQAGRIADKYGDRYPVIFGMIGLAVGMFFPYFFTTIWALYISQFIVGISNIFIAVSLQNVIGNIATESNRDQYFSMFGMAVAAASLIGPILGGYISEHYNYNSVFLVSLLLAISPIFISFKVPAIKKDVSEKKSIIESIGLLKIPLLKKALFSSALVLYSKDIFVAYFPILAKEADLSNSQIGLVISLQGLAMIIIRFVLPRLLILMSRDFILFISVILAGASFLLIPFTGSLIFYCVFSCLMGFGLGCGQPLSLTTTYNASPLNRTGEVLGLRLSTNRLSQLIAPIFFGLVGSWMGILSVFIFSGFFLIGGSWFLKENKTGSIQINK